MMTLETLKNPADKCIFRIIGQQYFAHIFELQNNE